MNPPLPQRVLRARMQLMLLHPYLAGALARLPVVNAAEMPWCRTMATDGYYIYVNPAFCATLSEPEITGVFAHEVMHVVLGHIDRRGDRQRLVWNMAIDFATNLLLRDFGVSLPKCGLLDARYRGLTAEQIYARLVADGVFLEVEGFDLHLEPGDVEGQNQRQRDYPSADERRRLRSVVLREMARERAKRGMGSLPGEMLREIQVATRSIVPWQHLLARFISDLRRTDYRLFPFHKKHLWRGIYMPSPGIPGPDHIVLAIDTSGSVSAKDLGQFVAELDRLRAFTDCKLTLLHGDAGIAKVDESEGRSSTILPAMDGKRRLAGGGGTDFRPVFDWITERKRKGHAQPDALIYCTDGVGLFPPRAPSYPVVWVVTPGSQAPFPFGQVIRLDAAESAAR
jgi:predicted metal-dependent peptidase